MFGDRPLLQSYVANKQPVYPLKPPIPPAHLILNYSAHSPADVPMLTVVLVVRQPTAATLAGPAYVYTHTTDVPMLTRALGCVR